MATFNYNQQYPWMQPKTPPTSGTANALPGAVPGFNNLSTSASGIISNLMGGLPSAAPTQRANAYFGTGSGMPGSDFVRNRGFDLYGQEAESRKQRGFDDFLKLLQGYSGTVAPTTGQQLQSEQFNANLASQERQADAQNMLQRKELAQRGPKALENSYAEFNPMGQQTLFRRGPNSYAR